ncbi:MAG: 4Fe-4S binding protein [Deltaproteobacteria bacterium]|nr:4Fe-4S binding protein [Deltaproteobacteria bacterium]
MSQYLLKYEPQRCISCSACELHCQTHHRLDSNTGLGILITIGPMESAGKPQTMSAFMPCFHCEKPWCIAACPTRAIIKRDSDGIVFIEKSLCVGCKACIEACPWKIPKWDEKSGKVNKCDYCRDRLEEGLKPACVSGCTAHALTFSRPNDTSRRTRAAYAKVIIKDTK